MEPACGPDTFDVSAGPSRLLIVTAVHAARNRYLAEAGDSVALAAAALAERDVAVSWSVCVDDGRQPGSSCIAAPDSVDFQMRSLVGQWGVSTARNVALSVARGDWVLPLDGDDVLVVDGVLAAVEELQDGVTWVATSRLELDGRPCRFVVPQRIEFAPGEVNATYSHPFTFHPNSVAYRDDVLVAAGGWPATPGGEDLALLLRVAREHSGVARPEIAVGYRRWDEQVTAGDSFVASRPSRHAIYSRFDLLGGRDPAQMRTASKYPPDRAS